VLTNLDLRPGMTGDGVVAQIQFAKEATPLVRSVSAAPVSPFSAPVLTTDGVDTLTWHYASIGDYDQNSEVNIADLTPLGVNFGEVGPFAYETSESVVDGDRNGEINLADITPIGQNFQRVVTGYGIYTSTNTADAGTNDNIGANDDHTIDSFDEVAFSTATGTVADRKSFSYTIAAVDPNAFYWVRPLDANDSSEGTRSNLVTFGTSNIASFSLQNPPVTGSGTIADHYVLADSAVLNFIVMDPDSNDVSDTAVYTVSDPGAGSVGAGTHTLNVTPGFTGNFFVSATFEGVSTAPSSIHFQVGTVTPGGLFIRPDPADADWQGASNAGDGDVGTVDNPWILHDGAFNPDTDSDGVFELEFSLQAATDELFADIIPNADLTWGTGLTPFNVTGINDAGSEGSFQVNMFTNGYVFAQDSELNESNRIYVVAEDLPTT
jgi:hypothetical protein